MKVILFGATGMIGQGVLRECLLDPDVEAVLAIGRAATGVSHPKLTEARPPDLSDLSALAGDLAGHDACLFCLGVSSVGMSEDAYRRITYDLTLAIAATLADGPAGLHPAPARGEIEDPSVSRHLRRARAVLSRAAPGWA